ncbi:hypothetical protein CWC22_006755 [Pseudoalteromonas rubra]|uniref:Lipoprotein n=1 Tax=Pseudoalteromonas rubra TaxID=43658 RepID=A0A5S3UTI0_9GAMM|nr:hypothetical protein [Pseudoalteromonas rubra]QPB82709.1 hypothetical protein CWC22_006755 [Pseudoalteromonas rubra]
MKSKKPLVGLAVLITLLTGCDRHRPELGEMEAFYFRNQDKLASVQKLACALQKKYKINFVYFRLDQAQTKLNQVAKSELNELVSNIKALNFDSLRIEWTQQGCLLSLPYWDNWWGSSGQYYSLVYNSNTLTQFNPDVHDFTKINWQRSFEFSKPLANNWSIYFLHAP